MIYGQVSRFRVGSANPLSQLAFVPAAACGALAAVPRGQRYIEMLTDPQGDTSGYEVLHHGCHSTGLAQYVTARL